MQLSVFITPILQNKLDFGNGICEQLSVISTEHQVNHTHNQLIRQSMDDSGQHNLTDSHCKFCLVLGQLINPVFLIFLLILFSLLGVKQFFILPKYIFRLHQKLYDILFQNRAPPIII